MGFYILYLIITSYFRVNCYYIQYVLEEQGKGCCKKAKTGMSIICCCRKIPSPNFVDLNSTFVYHSLANFNDFLQELKIEEGTNDTELFKME